MKGRNFGELERESEYLNANLEKLMQSIGIQDKTIRFQGKTTEIQNKTIESREKTRWTLDIVTKLQENKTGDSHRINMIKKALEESRPVDKEEINYLKNQYNMMQNAPDQKKKIQWTLDLIRKLQKYEIGNFQRISMIKKALEESKRFVDKEDVEYLKEKHRMLQRIH